jgi:hypothetical protein
MKNIFFKKKSCTTPTLWGWITFPIAAAVVFYCLFANCNSFLSINKPLDAKVLVIEGWLPEYALVKAAEEFRSKNYARVFSTGIKIEKGDFFWREKTYADMGAAAMRHLGLDSSSVIAVPAFGVKADRTFASACALRRWIDSTGQRISKVNLMSLGPHSRRSRLLFQKALGNPIKVGIISYPDETYDPHKWWKTSNGFKATVDEALSYCYTKLIFRIKKRDESL